MDFDELRFQEGWSRYQGEEVSVWPSVVNVIHLAYIAPTFPFRYVLWAMEKFRQGWKPEDFRIKPKKRKVVRG